MRFRPRGMLAVTVGILLLAACTSDSGEPPADAPNLDALPRLTIQEVARFGSLEDPDYGFSSIAAVDVDRDGNVFVFEGQAREIRVYSHGGELLRRMGGRGSGPGEFSPRGSVRFGVVGDTVWAFESTPERLTIYDRSGRLLSANEVETVPVTLHLPGRTTFVGPSLLGTDGLFIGDRGGTSLMGGEPGAQPVDTVHIPRVRFNPSGQVVDTIGSYPVVSSSPAEFLEVGRSRYLMPSPPSAAPLYVPLVDGLVRIDLELPESPARLRVTRFTHAGDTVRISEFSYQPKPFPDAVLDAAVARNVGVGNVLVVGGAEQIGLERLARDSAEARVVMRRRLNFPATQPPVRSVRVTDNGALWLQREDDDESEERWTVLDAEDQPIGELFIPGTLTIRWTDGRSAWAVERDEFGVPWLVLLRIVRAEA
jgi:hypothetical protein